MHPLYAHGFHLLAATLALWACGRTIRSGSPVAGFWWALVHLTLMGASGFGRFIDPASILAAKLQTGAYAGSLIALWFENRKNPDEFAAIPWVIAQTLVVIAGGGQQLLGLPPLRAPLVGCLHIGAVACALIGNLADARKVNEYDRNTNRLWLVVQVALALASGSMKTLDTLTRRWLSASS